MSLDSLLLILGSACLHVVQHVAIKQARERTAFVWWMWLWASVLFSPVLIVCAESIDARVWLILAFSALFEAIYYLAIARAYQSGELSVVYPLARGAAPVFLLGWTLVLLAERPTAGGIGGIGLIVAGLYLINLPRLGAWRECLQSLRTSSARWALSAGVCISLYTLLDKIAVAGVNVVLYTYLAMTLTLFWLTPGVVAAVGWRALGREWHASRWHSAAAGLAALAAYGIVLFVMQTGVSASYVGATREISVVFGTAAAIIFLKEKNTPMRVLGSALVSAGVAVIALLGQSASG
jgi:drug/metabolite transporter (DMT)-like permease